MLWYVHVVMSYNVHLPILHKLTRLGWYECCIFEAWFEQK